MSEMTSEQEMSVEERRELERLIVRGPRSRWGYWPFAVPFLFLVGAIVLHSALLFWLRDAEGGLEILLRRGSEVQPLFDDEKVVQLTLTWNFILILGLSSVCFLANQAFRCRVLMRKAAAELSLDLG